MKNGFYSRLVRVLLSFYILRASMLNAQAMFVCLRIFYVYRSLIFLVEVLVSVYSDSNYSCGNGFFCSGC